MIKMYANKSLRKTFGTEREQLKVSIYVREMFVNCIGNLLFRLAKDRSLGM